MTPRSARHPARWVFCHWCPSTPPGVSGQLDRPLTDVCAPTWLRRTRSNSPMTSLTANVSAKAGNSVPAWPHGAGRRRQPGILLDRDGTIIVDHGHVGTVDRVEFIDGFRRGDRQVQPGWHPCRRGHQSGRGRGGLYSTADVERVHTYIAERLADDGAHVDLFLYCPYHPEGVVAAFARASEDRKPGPGMARAAAEALGLELTSSWVVGDRPEDMELAAAVSASAVWVGPGVYPRPGVLTFPNLAAAAPLMLERITR